MIKDSKKEKCKCMCHCEENHDMDECDLETLETCQHGHMTSEDKLRSRIEEILNLGIKEFNVPDDATPEEVVEMEMKIQRYAKEARIKQAIQLIALIKNSLKRR